MIQTLKIKNVALIDEVTLNFDEMLNVISGETGAGKSIMLDSLSFVFGGRADRSLIRTGMSSMMVEVVFVNLNRKHIDFVKNELNINCDDELFLSRELDINGKNTCKINGELVPVAVVKKICLLLVDVHGQSEHLAILDNDYQLNIIDMFSKTAMAVLEELNNEIDKEKDIEKAIEELGGSEEEKQNQIDLFTYQIQEIENVNILENELEELSVEKKEMQQFGKINDCLRVACEVCQNSFGDSIIEKLQIARKSLQQISDINLHYKELAERLESVLIEIEDLNETAQEDLNNNLFDQERFNYIDNRIDEIKFIFRKYGGNYENLNKYYISIKEKLNNLLNSTEKYKELQIKKDNQLKIINNIQDKLSGIRKKSAEVLKNKIQEELRILGMPNARMDIEFSRINENFSSIGYDRVEFMFSSNLGFELKPLNKVVSGGEMSRVMLAYKIVVSEVDDIHTIVFDEIDSGLSGNVASIVAQYMARLSLNKQIIAISHLPQICAMADCNIKVEKCSDKTTTHTMASELKDEKLFAEIARLMGVVLDEKGLEVSKILKINSENYKNNLKKR